jgi:hypothetical protein
MAVAKLKRPTEDRLEELAERIAAEINERADKMTPERRARADSETKKIADRVRRRYSVARADTLPSLIFR